MPQPRITSADQTHHFACYPAAVLAFIVNAEEQFLLMAHPKRGGAWELVNGGLEAEETVLAGVLREAYEEAGAELNLRPLGTLHLETFTYDAEIPFMFSISYLLAYEGGEIRPGDDMAGSNYRWFTLAELESEEITVVVPPSKWLFRRALELYRLWHNQKHPFLQPPLKPSHPKTK